MRSTIHPKVVFSVKIFTAILLTVLLFALLEPILPYHHLHGDERYYIGRALQNLEFIQGKRPPNKVWFSRGNHPFSAEFIIGISLLLQGKAVAAPGNPWKVNITEDQLVAARRSALTTGLIGLASIVYLSLSLNFLAVPAVVLYLLSSPGFVDFSLRCMLDIYVASFTTLSLVSIYWYVTKKSRKALYMSALSLGLAIGSKTSWDPIIAGVIILLTIVLIETHVKDKLSAIIKFTALTSLSFIATSTITIVRLEDHIRSVLGPHGGRIRISSIVEQQPLTSIKNYNIFVFQQPLNIILFCTILLFIFLTILSRLLKSSVKSISLKFKETLSNDKLLLYLFLITLYVIINLLLTGLTFEYGRNYARHTLYQALLIAAALNYIYHISKRIGVLATLGFIFINIITLDSYITLFNKQYFSSGWGLWPKSAIPTWSIYVGYALLTLSIVFLIFSTTMFLTIAATITNRSVKPLIKKYYKHIVFTRERKHQIMPTKPAISETRDMKTRTAKQPVEEKTMLTEKLSQILEQCLKTTKAEDFIKEFAKYLNTYARYAELKGLTSRELIMKIAKEFSLNKELTLNFINEYEAFVYGKKKINENIVHEFRKELRKTLSKLLKHDINSNNFTKIP